MFFRTGERSFYGDWLPDGRVLKTLRRSLQLQSPHAKCMLNCLGIYQSRVEDLLTEGDVDFAASITQGDYREFEVYDASLRMRFLFQADTVRILPTGDQKLRKCDCP
jgi:hypothetical protein